MKFLVIQSGFVIAFSLKKLTNDVRYEVSRKELYHEEHESKWKIIYRTKQIYIYWIMYQLCVCEITSKHDVKPCSIEGSLYRRNQEMYVYIYHW